MAYATAVILLGWYPWNVLLLALLQLTKGREVSAGYGFVYEVQFVGEVMIAGFGILFFAGHRALLVAVNEWRSDFVLQKARGTRCLLATTQLFELCDHIFFV